MTFNFYDRNEDNWHLKYVLDLRSFVVSKLPEDCTFLSKLVGIVTSYEVCFVICLLCNNECILLVENMETRLR